MTRLAIVSSLILTLALATKASGQDSYIVCHECWEGVYWGTVHHVFYWYPDAQVVGEVKCDLYGDGAGWHRDCHGDIVEGGCWTHHPCIEGLSDADSSEVILAVETGEGLDILAGRIPDAVSFNETRSSIQVRNCAGDVIANYPIRAEIGLSP